MGSHPPAGLSLRTPALSLAQQLEGLQGNLHTLAQPFNMTLLTGTDSTEGGEGILLGGRTEGGEVEM